MITNKVKNLRYFDLSVFQQQSNKTDLAVFVDFFFLNICSVFYFAVLKVYTTPSSCLKGVYVMLGKQVPKWQVKGLKNLIV